MSALRVSWILSLAALAQIGCGSVSEIQPDAGQGGGDDASAGGDAGADPDSGPGTDLDADEPTPAVAEILFPPADALTDATEILVRGTATDPDGIAAVRVNGETALTSNGFETWQAEVSLEPGQQFIVVEVEDDRGDVEQEAARVELTVGPLLSTPTALAVDGGAGLAYVADTGVNALLEVDLDTGLRTMISDGSFASLEMDSGGNRLVGTRSGSTFFGGTSPGTVLAIDPDSGEATELASGRSPFRGIALEPDGSRGYVVIGATSRRTIPSSTDFAELALVDLEAGDVTTVSGGGSRSCDITGTCSTTEGEGGGPDFEIPHEVALDLNNSRALVIDAGLDAVVEVDLGTGDRTIVSADGTGSGPVFDNPVDILIDPVQNLAWVSDAALGAVIEVDLGTGDRTILSGETAGSGPTLAQPDALGRSPAGDLLLADTSSHALVEVELEGGDRSVVSQSSIGNGPRFGSVSGLAVEPDTGRVLVGDSQEALLSVARDTGDRSVVASGDDVSAVLPDAAGPSSIALSLDATAPLASHVLATYASTVLAIDSESGEVEIVSGDGEDGPALAASVRAIALSADETQAFMFGFDDQTGGTVYAIDLATGSRERVAHDERGTGDDLPNVQALHWAPDSVSTSDSLLAVDTSLDGLYSIDLATGNRRILSNTENGSGEPFSAPISVAVGADGTTALVVDSARDAIIEVNLSNGNRSVVSGLTPEGGLEGSGPAFRNPRAIQLGVKPGVAGVIDSRIGLVAVDLANGQRVVVSH